MSAGVCGEILLKDESVFSVGGNLKLERLLRQMMNAERLHATFFFLSGRNALRELTEIQFQHQSGERIRAGFGNAPTLRPFVRAPCLEFLSVMLRVCVNRNETVLCCFLSPQRN